MASQRRLNMLSCSKENVTEVLDENEMAEIIPGRFYLSKDGKFHARVLMSGHVCSDDVSFMLGDFVFASSGEAFPNGKPPSEAEDRIVDRLVEYLDDAYMRIYSRKAVKTLMTRRS